MGKRHTPRNKLKKQRWDYYKLTVEKNLKAITRYTIVRKNYPDLTILHFSNWLFSITESFPLI